MMFGRSRLSVMSSNAQHSWPQVKSCLVGSTKILTIPRAILDEFPCTARLFLTWIAAEPGQELFHSVTVLNRGCTRRFFMRIAQIAPLMESVPPRLYGGTERIVSYLADELVEQGH